MVDCHVLWSLPWIRFAGYEFDGEEALELYNITEDFSQNKIGRCLSR